MGTRRDFLKKSAMLTTAAMVAPTVLSSCGKKQKEIGLQIYTVRDQLNEDLEGTLKKVAELGYNSVEAAGLVMVVFTEKNRRNLPRCSTTWA